VCVDGAEGAMVKGKFKVTAGNLCLGLKRGNEVSSTLGKREDVKIGLLGWTYRDGGLSGM